MKAHPLRRIGILGGTFNPIHIGHLAIAQAAWEKFRLDKVYFIPCYLPPHKKIPRLACAQDRLNMTRLAVKGNPAFEVLDPEVRRQGKSFTIDTLRYLRDIWPKGTKIFFIIGQDSFSDLPSWKGIETILKMASFIVLSRPGYKKAKSSLPHHLVPMPGLEVSSSYLRTRLREGKSIKYLVPEKVFEYIDQKKLYQKI